MREDQSRIEIAKVQAKSMAQVAQDYEDQFKIATKSLLDVVNAYSELSNVEQLEVRAEYDLMMAKLDYLSAAGALGEWAGIPLQSVHEEINKDVEAVDLNNMVVFEEGGSDVTISAEPAKKRTQGRGLSDESLPAHFLVNDKGELLLAPQK